MTVSICCTREFIEWGWDSKCAERSEVRQEARESRQIHAKEVFWCISRERGEADDTDDIESETDKLDQPRETLRR